MARISIEALGLTNVEARLNTIEHRLGDTVKASAFAMEALEKYHRGTWGRGVVDEPATDVRWPGHGPLVNTGALKKSMTETGAAGAIREITPYGLKYGTSIPYAGYLQRGTRKMKKKPVIRDKRALAAVMGYAIRRWVFKEGLL